MTKSKSKGHTSEREKKRTNKKMKCQMSQTPPVILVLNPIGPESSATSIRQRVDHTRLIIYQSAVDYVSWTDKYARTGNKQLYISA